MAQRHNGDIKVAVVEEHEILRHGLVAALAEDHRLAVTTAEVGAPLGADIDVAVASPAAVRRGAFACPVVVHTADGEALAAVNGGVAGVLARETLTAAQLRATVHAAAAGLEINARQLNGSDQRLAPRDRLVVELIADGYTTREIAARMSYSERTIKKLITALQERLEARSRPQIVAHAIRRGLI